MMRIVTFTVPLTKLARSARAETLAPVRHHGHRAVLTWKGNRFAAVVSLQDLELLERFDAELASVNGGKK